MLPRVCVFLVTRLWNVRNIIHFILPNVNHVDRPRGELDDDAVTERTLSHIAVVQFGAGSQSTHVTSANSHWYCRWNGKSPGFLRTQGSGGHERRNMQCNATHAINVRACQPHRHTVYVRTYSSTYSNTCYTFGPEPPINQTRDSIGACPPSGSQLLNPGRTSRSRCGR
jgi:hypothetical protein